MLSPQMIEREYRDFHLFVGIGGGAHGFKAARFGVGSREGRWRCIGGIDIDAGAIENFSRIIGARGTVRDLMSREQYIDFHGHEPPPGWVEATPEDIRAAAGHERPLVIALAVNSPREAA